MTETPKKILLKGNPIQKEAVAAAAITPGHLIARDADGKFAVHGSAGGNAAAMFARERDYIGKDLTDAYAADEITVGLACRPGDEIYALLADGVSVTPASFLESAGDGTLRLFSNQSNQFSAIVARPLETLDNSAGGAVARLKVEVL